MTGVMFTLWVGFVRQWSMEFTTFKRMIVHRFIDSLFIIQLIHFPPTHYSLPVLERGNDCFRLYVVLCEVNKIFEGTASQMF